MKAASKIKGNLADEWIPRIYESKIRVQRTRAYSLDILPRINLATIQHTLLGIELKVGNRRFACPDLSTARYLQVFAWIGCQDFAIPYDITRISNIADELESSWHKTLLFAEEESKGSSNSVKGRVKSATVKLIRSELEKIGSGAAIPEFKKTTKQEKYRS